MIRQAAILCGGMGTRLGELTARTPKPLLPVAGAPFLDVLVEEAGRQGFDDIVLLAGHLSPQIEAFVRDSAAAKRRGVNLRLSIEPRPSGTGGAVRCAREFLADRFVLMNGDSWFDINLRALAARGEGDSNAVMTLALRSMPDVSRYGSVSLVGGKISGFQEKASRAGPGLMNGGIYVCDKEKLLATMKRIAPDETESLSLETQVMPALVADGRLNGEVYDGYFIDIGLTETYAAAQREIPAHQRRPAVFFDRDGVLNVDSCHVGTIERFHWIEGAIAAIRACNDLGYFTFVVTNQAGVAKGLYQEADVRSVHQYMQESLAAAGAHIDDFRYCPYHVDAVVPEYKRESDWRKPAPGMFHDLVAKWKVDTEHSFCIGDKTSDLDAAAAVGLPGYLFEGGNLCGFLLKTPPFSERRARQPSLSPPC